MDSFTAGSYQHMSAKTVFATSDITPRVRSHLQAVYINLAGTVLAATLGALAHFVLGIGGILTHFASLGCIFAISTINKREESKRLLALLSVGFFSGASIGPLLVQAVLIRTSLITSAFAGSVLIFGALSLAALQSERRSWLFLGGLLGSAISVLLVMSLLSIFWSSMFMFNVQLYGGLLVFTGFVLFDTQLIIERASKGDFDHIAHATDLFIDFLGIFVRVLIFLMKNAESKKGRSSRRSD